MTPTTMPNYHPQHLPSQQLDPLMASVYSEVRRIVQRRLQGDHRGSTLQTTALVKAAYVKLRDLREADWNDQEHFFTVVASIMRRVLVEQARARRGNARVIPINKRGDDALRVTLDQYITSADNGVDMISLDAALNRLDQHDEVQVRIVELRYFAGLSIAETARMLGSSLATVERKWALARNWLYSELNAA